MILRPPFQLVGEAPEEAVAVSFDKFDLATNMLDLRTTPGTEKETLWLETGQAPLDFLGKKLVVAGYTGEVQ